MNTTKIGDSLEENIYNLFLDEIDAGRFFAKKDCCKIYRKKGYYSKDRGSNIIFDISIEIYLPGAKNYSLLALIECKNYGHAVPVDDVEEFFQKTQQVSGANIKGIIVTTKSFQRGALNFSKSKGIGLVRYFDRTNFKWDLNRSPSAAARSDPNADQYEIQDGLIYENYCATRYDLYFQGSTKLTNSLWDFIEDTVLDSELTPKQIRKITNLRGRSIREVKYLDYDDIESLATTVLHDVAYQSGEVSLDAICALEKERTGLIVEKHVSSADMESESEVLGKIVFSPLKISIYTHTPPNFRRERFTLAHELGHHFLSHGKYISSEFCQNFDFTFENRHGIEDTDIDRMEWQANYFASCLLLPKLNIVNDFREMARQLGLSDRGFGILYLDNQPCNTNNFNLIANFLVNKYKANRSAITYRLTRLGLITDARNTMKKLTGLN